MCIAQHSKSHRVAAEFLCHIETQIRRTRREKDRQQIRYFLPISVEHVNYSRTHRYRDGQTMQNNLPHST